MNPRNVLALVLRSDERETIFGIYTDDEEGRKLLDRVKRNWEFKKPDGMEFKVQTWAMNVPNN